MPGGKRAKQTSQIAQLLDVPGSWPDYLKPIAQEIGSKYHEFLGEAGKGKTGVVFKIKNSTNNHLYSLKTVGQKLDDREREKVRDTLKKEVEILQPLDHRCLPRIHERNLSGRLPYYVYAFHPGITFSEFKASDRKLNLEQSVFVIWSLMDVVKYLHEEGRTHCDLHTNNVLLSENVFQHGILVIDFGSGHRQSDPTPETANRGNVLFKDVVSQAHDRQTVSRREMRPDFQSFDFVALGSLLAQMERCFFGDASSIQSTAYFDFCRALRDGRISSWKDAHEKFLSVIDPYRILTATRKLFLSELGLPQAITVPGARAVPVGEACLAVVNTKVFQRLRNVKQLSFCDWYFPGASHTRFEHSLGVFNAAQQALNWLVHDRSFRDQFSERNIRGFLLAALVHDVGHYPFAHVLEHYVAGRFAGAGDEQEARKCVSHAQNTIHVLESDKELLAAISEHWGSEIANECIKVLENKVTVLSDLIDGPIDIDKIDYLGRDALHCGMPFGNGLDVQGLLRSMTCVDSAQHLGIRDTGVSAAEGLMILQDQMLASVYWQPSVRGIICMFHAVLAHIIRTDLGKLRDLTDALRKSSGDYDAITQIIIPRIRKDHPRQAGALERLVRMHAVPDFRDIYAAIRTYRISDQLAVESKSRSTVFETIVPVSAQPGSTIAIKWDYVSELRTAFRDAFKEKRISMANTDLVIDVPFGKNAHRMVYVSGDGQRPDYKITEVSHLNASIFERPAAFSSPIRVYVAPKLYTRAGGKLASIIKSADERFDARKISKSEATNNPTT